MKICSSYCQGKSYEHPIWTTKSAVPLADVVWQCDQRSSRKMNFFLIKISSKSHKLHCLHLKIKLCDVNNIFRFKENVTFGNKMALTPGKVLLPVNRSCKFQVSTPLQLRVKMKHPDKVSGFWEDLKAVLLSSRESLTLHISLINRWPHLPLKPLKLWSEPV